MYHLQKRDGSHQFNSGVTFNDIVQHYQFDKKLRSLFLVYIERLEIALRARLSNSFSLNHGFYWYTEYDLFADKQIYDSINAEIKEYFGDPQERFLKAFQNKYTSESLPPSNMAMEILTMGKLSRLYQGVVNKAEKLEISLAFGTIPKILSSWFITLTIIRNICAHHSRLWNRNLSASKPIIPNKRKERFNGEIPDNFASSLYGVISICDRMLGNINPNNSFIEKMEGLLDEYPAVNTKLMGFPVNWKEHPAWKRIENSADQ